MTNNYYENLILEIESLIESNQMVEAEALILLELKQLYIPGEIENKLKSLLSNLKSEQEPVAKGPMPISVIKTLLQENQENALYGAMALNQYNLNLYLDLIEDYLKTDPQIEVAAILIESCIKQGILKELLYNKAGTSYHFIPAYLELPLESDGYIIALKQLELWLENSNPSLLKLSKERLVEKVYQLLPESYNEDEGELLASKVLKEVAILINDEATLLEISEIYQVDFTKELT